MNRDPRPRPSPGIASAQRAGREAGARRRAACCRSPCTLAFTLWPVRLPDDPGRDAAAGDDHRDAAAAEAGDGRRAGRGPSQGQAPAAGTRRRAPASAPVLAAAAERPSPASPRPTAWPARRPTAGTAAGTRRHRTPPPRRRRTRRTRRCRRASISSTRCSSARRASSSARPPTASSTRDNQYRIATVGEARGLAALLLRGQGRIESRGHDHRAAGCSRWSSPSSAAAASGARPRSSTGRPAS